MKKNILLIIALSVILISAAWSAPMIKTAINLEYSYDTNVFSNPLPMYDSDGDWLEWRAEYPFIRKHSIGFNVTADLFPKKTSRVGISTSLNVKFPLNSISTIPVPEDEGIYTGNWEYVDYDSSENQKTAVFWGLGPIFMAQFSFVDLGCAIRLSLGGYDYTDHEVIIGIQAEPFANFHVSQHAYVSIKLTYDAHLMRFINSENEIYTPNYQMISAAPSIGIGFKF